MTDLKFSEMHLFLDETGLITDSNDALNALGGVLFFGRYDHNVDLELRDILGECLSDVGGSFPGDLHFSQSKLKGYQLREACKNAGTQISELFAHRPLTNIQGVVLHHQESIFTGAKSLLIDEDKRDNRYLALLQAFLEQLLFIDAALLDRLTEDWTLHLHIASRTIPLTKDQSLEREAFLQAGYSVISRYKGRRASRKEEPDEYFVQQTLNERDVEQILRNLQTLRWKDKHLNIGTIEVSSIDYQSSNSPAGLYLADLFLGQYRQKKLYQKKLNLLPTFRELSYGPWLSLLSQMALAASEKQVETYLDLRLRLEEYDAQLGEHLSRIITSHDHQMAPLLREKPDYLLRQLEKGATQIDTPGKTSLGFRQVERAYRYLEEAQALNARAKMIHFQSSLSHANHMGSTAMADKIWEEYTHFSEELGRPGVELAILDAEIRNRRAVSLTDHFRHAEAIEVLVPVIETQETLAELVGDRDLKNTIGACYGTLGQAEAFLGNHESAESFFRHALSHFEDPRDQERQWIYLGHLANDMPPEEGKPLWAESIRELSALRDAEQALSSGSQYLIALFMKSCLVFSSPAQLLKDLHTWKEINLLGQFSEEDRAHHPFGLIYQTRARCHDRLLRSDLELDRAQHLKLAREDYDRAEALMLSSGPLLQLLGLAAALRRELLLAYLDPAEGPRLHVGRAFKNLRSHIETHFGPQAWDELEEGTTTGYFGQYDPGPGSWIARSEAVLNAIRFNYW